MTAISPPRPAAPLSHLAGVALVCVSAVVFSTAGIFTKAVDANAWSVIFWGLRKVTRTQIAGYGLSVAVLGLGLHDLLIQTGHLDSDEPHLFGFAAPVVIFSFSVILTVRFVQTFNRARALNVALEG